MVQYLFLLLKATSYQLLNKTHQQRLLSNLKLFLISFKWRKRTEYFRIMIDFQKLWLLLLFFITLIYRFPQLYDLLQNDFLQSQWYFLLKDKFYIKKVKQQRYQAQIVNCQKGIDQSFKNQIEIMEFSSISNNLKMSQFSSKKHSDSQFICKLQDMMEKHPTILAWSQDGKELVVNDVSEMQREVLPHYFRHQNFGSFVRQLNMYNFHKVCRQNNSINFKNDIFKQGNEANFHQIKRKKKTKDEQTSESKFRRQYEEILKNIEEDPRLALSVKNLMRTLIEFKFIAIQNQKKIKRHIDSICKELKDSRSKRITEIVSKLKANSLEQLDKNLNLSQSIDNYIEEGLGKQSKEHKPHFQQNIPVFENRTLKDLIMDVQNCGYHSQNSLLFLNSKADCMDQNHNFENNQDSAVSFLVEDQKQKQHCQQ